MTADLEELVDALVLKVWYESTDLDVPEELIEKIHDLKEKVANDA